MGDLHFLSLLFAFRVTGKAEFTAFHVQKFFIFGSVRTMAGEASLVACHRCVREGDPLIFLLMAVEAKVVQLLQDKFRVLRGMGLVARVAHPLFERGVVHRSPLIERGSVMAIETEVASFLSGSKRFWGGSGVMA